MTPVSFKGVFPIAITPFDSDEHIDLESFRRIIRFMASLGVDGVTILGVLGESNRLIDKEREALIQTAVAAAGTLPIIVGTSHSGTRATCDLSQMAEGLGAAGVMVTPSREAVPNPDRVFEYFQRVAASISIPIVAQDHPASTQVHMALPLVLRLIREIPQIACIKQEATPTPPKTRALLAPDGPWTRDDPNRFGRALRHLRLGQRRRRFYDRFRLSRSPASPGARPQQRPAQYSAQYLPALPTADRLRTTTWRGNSQGNLPPTGSGAIAPGPPPRQFDRSRNGSPTTLRIASDLTRYRHHPAHFRIEVTR